MSVPPEHGSPRDRWSATSTATSRRCPFPAPKRSPVLTKRRLGLRVLDRRRAGSCSSIVARASWRPILPLAEPDETLERTAGQRLHDGQPARHRRRRPRPALAHDLGRRASRCSSGSRRSRSRWPSAGTIGLIAGFYRGWTGEAIIAIFDIALAFPAVVLALLLITFLGQQLQWILLVIGILAIAPDRPAGARPTRSRTRPTRVRHRGARARREEPRIIWQEIFPNVLVPMTGLALLGMALAIVAEGSLAFLGLSVEGSTPDLGEDDRGRLVRAPRCARRRCRRSCRSPRCSRPCSR